MTPYYQDNSITIYCGDCLEVMPQLEPPVDAIIADWPYGTTACEWDSIIPLEPLWKECKRLIKSNGAIVLTASQPFTTDLINSARSWFKYEWVWDKNIATGGQNSKIMPMKAHENVLLFCGGQPIYNPQKEKLSIDEIKRLRKKDYDKPMGEAFGRSKMIVKSRSKVINEGATKYPRSILRINGVHACSFEKKQSPHPTQKPVALMSYLIRTYTNPGELILDNTMGSGTTLVAAKNNGRRAIGIDIDEHWCKVAVDRLTNTKYISLPNGNGKLKAQQLELVNCEISSNVL